MEFTPYVCAAIITLPMLFPRIFWKNTDDDKIKFVFYNVVKKNANPYFEEATSFSIYDPDAQKYFVVDDIYDDDTFEEMCTILLDMTKGYSYVYFVTYDIEYKEVCFKTNLQELIESNNMNARFIDLKQLFYSQHIMFDKLVYNTLLEYYHIPKLNCKPIEYCAIFDQLLQDYDINIKDNLSKIHILYSQLNPMTS